MMLKVWWLKKPSAGNYGDLLTPYVFDHFGIEYKFSKRDFQAISVGSVARVASKNTIVLGSGILSDKDSLAPDADWRLVRGPRTRNKILERGGTCSTDYGDPGAMLSEIVKPGAKKYDVGIIPHFIDNAVVEQRYPNYHRINLLGTDILETTRKISECRFVISSSLHGIIVAHSYDIPAAWVRFSDNLEGDDIKFLDYHESVGVKLTQSTVEDPVFTLPRIDIKSTIEKVFKDLKNEFN